MSPRRATIAITACAAIGRWPLAWALHTLHMRRVDRRAQAEVALADTRHVWPVAAYKPSKPSKPQGDTR